MTAAWRWRKRVAGSESLFVDRMNARAKELGAENTLFANCTGLPKEPQYSCARDVAKMLSELVSHEEYFSFSKIWTDRFEHPKGRYTDISNTNRLVRFYEGCDGGKTGFTSQAGFCLAATAKRGSMRLISVVIGEDSSDHRFGDIRTMFDYAFATYTLKTVVDDNNPLNEIAEVSGGKIAYREFAPRTQLAYRCEKRRYGGREHRYPYRNEDKSPRKSRRQSRRNHRLSGSGGNRPREYRRQ